MNDDPHDVLLIFIVIIIACSLTAIATSAIAASGAKRAALENNCGRYHQKTGNFEWIAQPRQSAAGEAE